MGGKAPVVAVLSGKGGTGKTLVSVNLAAAAPEAVYLDCDVEEPDGDLFFKSAASLREQVTVRVPEIDAGRCVGCRKCVDFCAFHALAFLGGRPVLFDEVCHACGGCALVCPEKAIREKEKAVGTVTSGVSGRVAVHTGRLSIGEASGIPVIRKVLQKIPVDGGAPVFIDCPPGSGCAVMESLREADYCVLVAEPTVFGAHNLAMVHELAVLFGRPCGVVLNKDQPGENPSEAFCTERGLPILGRIPYDARLGLLSSEGKIAVREDAGFRALFKKLLDRIGKEARHEAAADPQR